MSNPKTALLLINVGTPDSPEKGDVRRYLKQFLSDPRVIDIPAVARWLLLRLVILPRRPRRSAAAYAKIWTLNGSPLLAHGRDLALKVQAGFAEDDVSVELAMRYGNPSIASALDRLREQGVTHIVALPLYPHYSSATTGSSVEALWRAASPLWNTPYLQIVPAFYDHPAFVEAFARIVQPTVEQANAERVLFSYHGLPERQCRKGDASGKHCLVQSDCCDAIGPKNASCYRAQCLATTRILGDRLGIAEDQRVTCFQSRLGRTKWIQPYTDATLAELAAQGVKRITVLTPSFAADCLETIEEIGIRARQTWHSLGGEQLTLAPCPNSHDAWADAIVTISRAHMPWKR